MGNCTSSSKSGGVSNGYTKADFASPAVDGISASALPELEGSVKQVKLANDLRNKYVDALNKYLESDSRGMSLGFLFYGGTSDKNEHPYLPVWLKDNLLPPTYNDMMSLHGTEKMDSIVTEINKRRTKLFGDKKAKDLEGNDKSAYFNIYAKTPKQLTKKYVENHLKQETKASFWIENLKNVF